MMRDLLPEVIPPLSTSLYFRLKCILDWQNSEIEQMQGTLGIMIRIRSVYLLEHRFKMKRCLRDMELLHEKLLRYQYYLALYQKDKLCKTHSPKVTWLVKMVQVLVRTLIRAK